MNFTFLLLFIITIFIITLFWWWWSGPEKFGIPLESSSAFNWTVGTDYNSGDTGYGLYGMWPASLPKEPWTWWQWGRRPLIFVDKYTPVPQIDYNTSPVFGPMVSNYNISLLPTPHSGPQISVNGFVKPNLQLDRNRVYWFHIYLPGSLFVLSRDRKTAITNPISEGTVSVKFTEQDPDTMWYGDINKPEEMGIIYLNSTRWFGA